MDRRDAENAFHQDISRELGGVNQRLAGIESSIEGLVEQVKIANGRTRKLEDWKLKITTQLILVASLVSFLVSVVVMVVVKLI